MELFGNWIIGITSAAVICSVVFSLTPEGHSGRFVRLAGSACILIAIFLPLGNVSYGDLSYPERPELSEASDKLEKSSYDLQRIIIEEKIAAYISQKANALGLDIDVEVVTESRNGVPLPVSIMCRYQGSTEVIGILSTIIEEDVGIPFSSQKFTRCEP